MHLASGHELGYDVLLLALGAKRRVTERQAITFLGPESTGAMTDLLQELRTGRIKRVAFVVPAGVSWPLPLYELAVLTARDVRSHGVHDARVWLVTPELDPLAAFGRRAGQEVGALLADSGVTFFGSADAAIGAGSVLIGGDRHLDVDRVVTIPVLEGPRVPGIPCDPAGFVPVDGYGRVAGAFDVYAVGDGAAFAHKQGGLAAQQADAAATAIAAEAGADVEPQPFRPVLRTVFLTGGPALSMRYRPVRGSGYGDVTDEPLWSPPVKIAGRYLAPYLHKASQGAPLAGSTADRVPAGAIEPQVGARFS
jgi:sulfide:quinone oxidoreductase